MKTTKTANDMDKFNIDYNKNIGENIRYERMLRNFTLEDLSYFIDISPSTLGLIERGKRGVSIKNLCKFADFFSITVDDLIRRDIVGVTETNHRSPRDQREFVVDSLLRNLNSNELDYVTIMIKELVKFRKTENKFDF